MRLVQDTLNTHTPAALYETFPPAEARRILQRLEFHYTPRHGRGREYGRDRDRYFGAQRPVTTPARRGRAARVRVSAVETERNEQRRGIRWQFTARDARMKLEKLYPIKPPSSN